MEDVEEQATLMEEAMEVTFDEIEKLESLGVNATDVNKLKAAGIFTVGGVRMQTKKVNPFESYPLYAFFTNSIHMIVFNIYQGVI